jgi:hypothetical protein
LQLTGREGMGQGDSLRVGLLEQLCGTRCLYGWGVLRRGGAGVMRVAPAPTRIKDGGGEEECGDARECVKRAGEEGALHGWSVRL